jgi:dTDP-glucose 4,6-dehydratase
MRAVIPTIIAQALTGNVIRLGNLTTRRDLTFVSDTVAGFLKAGEASEVEGQVFNLGTGSETSIDKLAREIISLIGRPIEIVVDEMRLRPEKSEVLRLLSDNRLAKDVLGWEPLIHLRDGLAQTISWMMEHPSLYRPDVYQL